MQCPVLHLLLHLLLLLLLLLSGPAGAPPTGSESQDVYEVEEHHNVTITCRFSVMADLPPPSKFSIDLWSVKYYRVYFYDNQTDELYIHPLYRHRLSCLPPRAFEGHVDVDCLLINVTLNDDDTYHCIVAANGEHNVTKSILRVKADRRPPEDEVPTRQPEDEVPTRQPEDEVPTRQPEDEVPTPLPRHRMCLYVCLLIFVIVAISIVAVPNLKGNQTVLRFLSQVRSPAQTVRRLQCFGTNSESQQALD